MTENIYDDMAYLILSSELSEIAKEAVLQALAKADLNKIIDDKLPGLTGETRAKVLEAGEYMTSNGAQYLGLIHPAERHVDPSLYEDMKF